MDLTYNYVDANGHNNGNVATITNNVMPERTQNFTYDSLNRIATAQTTDTNQPDWNGDPGPNLECWAEQYSYDPWGNLLAIAPGPSAYTGCVQESGFNFTGLISAKNQIAAAGYAYDAAGNLIAAPPTGTTYTYDAENHLASTGGVTYTYDGDGKRVTKSSGTIYSYLPSGEVLMESSLSSGYEQFFYYYFNGQRVANTNNLNAPNEYGWYFTDHLGSTRFYWQWDGDGGWNRSDFYPFGGEVVISSDEPSHYKFTGKERDSESGNDNFGARYYSSSLGRFMSPDAFYKDSHVGDPQSWNEYAYSRNNPLRYVDPNGEKADVSTNCTTDQQNHTTCNVNISASIAVYATSGSNLSQDQLNAAAVQVQSSIQNAWSGSFTQDGVTYNVSTQISVSVAGSEADATKSGAQNVIRLSNGPADAAHNADSFVNNRSLLGAITGIGPDTGVWNINSLASGVAAHEFTHLLGVDDKSGSVLSNTAILLDPALPHSATGYDFRWGIREAIGGVNLNRALGGAISCDALCPAGAQGNSSRVGVQAGGALGPFSFWWK